MNKVYLETSIFSFYYDERTQPDIVARRNWTRAFWEVCKTNYAMFTSVGTLTELNRGNKPHKDAALKLAQSLPAYPIVDEIKSIVAVYIKEMVMPRDPFGDALHLAFASFYKCDFLVTWNCEHLANANKLARIRLLNFRLGLHTPEMVTPLELLGKNPDEI
jgi:predicted nucleic acid-binding protein